MTATAEAVQVFRSSPTEVLIARECWERRARLEVELGVYAQVTRGELPPVAELLGLAERLAGRLTGEPGGGFEALRVYLLLFAWAGALRQWDPDGRLMVVESALSELGGVVAYCDGYGWPFGVLPE